MHNRGPFFLRIATVPWVPSSRPRAEVALTISLSTHATIAMYASVSRLVTTTHGDDVDNHTTIFFILPATDMEFSALVARLAFRLFKLLRQSVSFTFGTEEDSCSKWEFLSYLHFIPRCPHGLPWHACAENYKRLFLNKTQLFSAVFILQSSARCRVSSPLSFHYEPLPKLLVGNSRSCSEFSFGSGNFADASPSGDNSE